ncbi:hypothetical protein EC957_004093 [Mortierella hygrophila]|uniref:Myb-like domain-containing protein n=1 Tax=Mortierella hygrophila TaxID=979708 RepID=A0A9P6K8U4_9FUNG|nr:hypothetical protein EC957_004093 [Mortierella hygrophila]
MPTSLHTSDSSYNTSSSTSWTSGNKVQQQQRRAAAKRQSSSQTHEIQPRHQHLTRKQHRRLQDAHEEYHRQRELFQAQQQQQQEQQQYYHHHQQTSIEHTQHQEEMYSPQPQSSGLSSSSSGQYPPYAAPFAPSQRFSSLSRSSSSSSIYHSSLLDPIADATEATTKPRSRRSSPGLSDHHHHPPRQRGPYSTWTAIRENERHRLLTNLSTLRESLQTVPLPSQVARENLGRLHQRIQRRRARARETILYDLHQGVKVVEAQVHRQVEMVLSRLKEAPASKYAFALTNSFLSQVIPPTSVTGSLLAQAANGLFYQAESSSSSTSTYAQQHQQQQQQEANGSRSETESLTDDFDSIALAGQLGTDPPSALAGLGDPNRLSTIVPPGVAAACTQILSAALPSFIPSMVAPLVCVFSYQTPAISDLVPIPYTPYPWSSASSSSSSSTAAGVSSSSNTKVEEPARKEFVYPWGHPNEPYPAPPPPTSQSTPPTTTPATRLPPSSPSLSTDDKSRKQPQQQQQLSTTGTSHPDPGIVIVHSKTWTQHEREALYLAATRFRLSGQWSKIREMMSLHRTDAEIESEYKKLYGHRDPSDDPLLDDDEDDIESHYDARPSIIDAMTYNQQSNINSEEDDDADDETETMIFMKFGGARSANQKRQQLQHLQSRRLHYDHLHFQPPVPQQELQHQHQIQQNYHHPQQQQYQNNGAVNVPPLHDTNTPYQQQQQQRLSSDPDPIRIFKKEFMIDKRFSLEEIPMRI